MSHPTIDGASHVHGGTPTARREPVAAEPTGALVLVHGRGATAESILGLADELPPDALSERIVVAPQASESSAHPRSWYPRSFLAPIEGNQPALDSALRRLEETMGELEDAGIPRRRIALAGFSQGACLALDYALRSSRERSARGEDGRWAAVAAFTGGLIGPPGTQWPGDGDVFRGTPVFLGSSDRDPHVPLERVKESSAVFRRLGADVEERIYPGMPHTVVRDELEWLGGVLSAAPAPGLADGA